MEKKKRNKLYKKMLKRNRWVNDKDMLFGFLKNFGDTKEEINSTFPELAMFNEPLDREPKFSDTIKKFKKHRNIALLLCIEITR